MAKEYHEDKGKKRTWDFIRLYIVPQEISNNRLNNKRILSVNTRPHLHKNNSSVSRKPMIWENNFYAQHVRNISIYCNFFMPWTFFDGLHDDDFGREI